MAQRSLRIWRVSFCLALAACREANNDVAACAEGQSVSIDVLRNDGARAHFESLTSHAQHGRVELDGHKLIYTPSEHYNGEDSFEYEVSWGLGQTARARVTVQVTPDDPPNTERTYALPFAARKVAALDVDGDGLTDILATDSSGNLSLLRATDTRAATLDYAVSGSASTVGPNNTVGGLEIAIADLNRDGVDDALISGLLDIGLVAVLGPAVTADELVQVPLQALSEDMPFYSSHAIGGDFDGDGQPDLIAQERFGARDPLVLYTDFGIHDASISFAARIELEVRRADDFRRVNADGNGADDLVIVGNGVQLWLGSPSGPKLTQDLQERLYHVFVLGHDYPDNTILGVWDGQLFASPSFSGVFEPTIPAQRSLQPLHLHSGIALVAEGEGVIDFYSVHTSPSVDVTFLGDIWRDHSLIGLSVHDLDDDGTDEVLESLETYDTQTGKRSEPRLRIRTL